MDKANTTVKGHVEKANTTVKGHARVLTAQVDAHGSLANVVREQATALLRPQVYLSPRLALYSVTNLLSFFETKHTRY